MKPYWETVFANIINEKASIFIKRGCTGEHHTGITAEMRRCVYNPSITEQGSNTRCLQSQQEST
jgi:hypothetical protein